MCSLAVSLFQCPCSHKVPRIDSITQHHLFLSQSVWALYVSTLPLLGRSGPAILALMFTAGKVHLSAQISPAVWSRNMAARFDDRCEVVTACFLLLTSFAHRTLFLCSTSDGNFCSRNWFCWSVLLFHYVGWSTEECVWCARCIDA